MNLNEIKNVINLKLNGKEIEYPKFLYKYRPFDEFAFDMLENNYLYLCPAEKLDDQSECKVSLEIQDLYDLETNQLKFRCVEGILEYIKPYTSKEKFEKAKEIIGKVITPKGYIKRNWLLDASFELQELVPDVDATPLINWLGNIPERLNDPIISENIKKLFSLALDARKDMGICSLSELKDSQQFWTDYAQNETGYCIEYDLSDYEYLGLLFPVIYNDDRKTNIANNIVLSFIGEMIFGMSNGQIMADRTPYMQMFLTKNTKWDYQKEWRLLGDANQKVKAPKIKTIYIGKNMIQENKEKLQDFCGRNGIMIYDLGFIKTRKQI